MSDTEIGQVQGIEVEEEGGNVVGDHAAGTTLIQLEDASEFAEIEGSARVGDTVVGVLSSDHEANTLTLAAGGLPVAVEDGDPIFVDPPSKRTIAKVLVDPTQPPLDVEVPFEAKAFSGISDGDTVRFEEDSETGALRVVEILGADPMLPADRIPNADELLLRDSMKTLGQELDEKDAAIAAARTTLEQTSADLDRAFGEIDLLPDDAYVAAAKQQAIDVANVKAKQLADEAEARAKALAATKIQTYVSPTTPTAPAGGFTVGDLWIDSDDGNKLSRWDGTTWASARDSGIAAGSVEAASALSKALEALSKAEAAQSTADGAIRTHYLANPPWADGSTRPQTDLGDMWFDTDDGQAYRWNGTAWQVIKDQSISQALAAAQNAQTTADGKITAYRQAAPPAEADEGDLWFDTDDKNKPYYRSGTQWVSIADTRIADQAAQLATVQGDLTGLSGRVDGKAVVYVQTATPTGLTAADQGDIWIDTTSGRLVKVWNGSMWVEADSRVAKAVVDITTKTTTYQTTSSGQTPATPAGGFTVGDLWIDRFAGDKISRWTGTAWSALDIASTAYVAAKGTDLVVNGTGYLRNNYNFSWATFDSTIAPVGTNGAFIAPAVQTTRFTDELLPYDPTKAYLVGFKTWQLVTGSQDRLYAGLAPFDAYGLSISPSYYMYVAGTTTTLAKALNPGDTTITLTSAANWWGQSGKPAGTATHQRSIIWWDYTDSGGKLWPAGSYSRNTSGANYWADGGIVGNVITLAAPYTGPVRAAGTSLSNGTAGGNYIYFPAVQNAIVPQTPTTYSEVLKAGTMDPALQAVATAGAATWLTGPPQMTASLKIVWLTNYPPYPTGPPRGQLAFAAITMSDAAAAQAKADATAATLTTVQSDLTGLSGRVDGKAVVYVQTLAPGGLTAADQGDIWIDTTGGARVVKVWSGTAWVEADSRTAKAVSDITTKTTTYLSSTAPTTPAGGFTVGDLWIDGNGKISRWSALGWVAAVDPKALADAAETRAKAFTTTSTNGVSKSVWSDALPGTTRLPQGSTWFQHDGTVQKKVVALLSQTAPTVDGVHGNTWVASPVTSEVIANLDAGKLTVAGDTVLNEALVKKIAADVGVFVKAEVGNLTVTGETHLNSAVAETIGADVGTFVRIVAEQILGGQITATIGISTDGAIICGDEAGAHVRIDDTGITIFDVDDDGVQYVSTSIGGPGADTFWITDGAGEKVAGFAEDGTVTGQAGYFSGDVNAKGMPVVGTFADPTDSSLEPGHLDGIPWGVIARERFTNTSTTRPSGEEWGYASLGATMIKGRVYRIGATCTAKSSTNSASVPVRLRVATDGNPVTINSPVEAQDSISGPTIGSYYYPGTLEGFTAVEATTDVEVLLSYIGANGGTATIGQAEIWIEDVGPSGSYGGGSYNTGGQTAGGGGGGTTTKTVRTYTSTWTATDSVTYKGDGTKRTAAAASGDIIQGYNSANGIQKGAFVFGGNASSGETGKTMGQALSGATVKKVEMYLFANHTYFGAGATVSLMRATQSSIPSTWSGVTRAGTAKTYSIKAGEGKWVTVDPTFASSRLFTVAFDSTSGTYYLRLNGHTDSPSYTRPKIRVTYER